MVDLGFPELSTEQKETLCAAAESAARKYVLSKVSSKLVDRLDICVETEGFEPLKVTVEVDLSLTIDTEGVNVDELVKEATSEAHKAVENYLRKLK